MPPPPVGGTKKKGKGRQPAHMNSTFAFRHNPKSKKTDKILESVNQHCCRRCHDKIEWRKKYRKYKPRTQPGSCNLCKQKRVKAAYHTICTKCTTSDQAWKLCREGQVKSKGGNLADMADEEHQKEGENDENDEEEDEVEGEIHNKKLAATLLALAAKPALRCCAVCVKAVALRDQNGNGPDIADIVARMGPMALRERRGLERQLLRQQQEVEGDSEGEGDDDDNEEEDAGDGDDKNSDQGDEMEQDQDDEKSTESLQEDENYREENDPLLQAVGGADKLLTGDAYQEKILAGEKPTTM